MGKVEALRRLVIASAILVVPTLPTSAGSNAYLLLRNTVEGHSAEDGLSKDVTSRICSRITIESLQDAAADHPDLTYNEQDYDSLYLKEGDIIWSLTIGDFMGSKNVTVIVNPHNDSCAAYLYFWTQ